MTYTYIHAYMVGLPWKTDNVQKLQIHPLLHATLHGKINKPTRVETTPNKARMVVIHKKTRMAMNSWSNMKEIQNITQLSIINSNDSCVCQY